MSSILCGAAPFFRRKKSSGVQGKGRSSDHGSKSKNPFKSKKFGKMKVPKPVRSSREVAGSIATLIELKRRITTFRDLLDFAPCSGPVPPHELLILTLKDISRRYPCIRMGASTLELKDGPIHKSLRLFCDALKSLGDLLTTEKWMVSCKYKSSKKLGNAELEQVALGLLDDIIKLAKERLLYETDEEEERYLRHAFPKPLSESYNSDSTKSPHSASPVTPTSVLPETWKTQGKCYSPPLFMTQRVQAAGKLSPVELKRISFYMLPHAISIAQETRHMERMEKAEDEHDNVVKVSGDNSTMEVSDEGSGEPDQAASKIGISDSVAKGKNWIVFPDTEQETGPVAPAEQEESVAMGPDLPSNVAQQNGVLLVPQPPPPPPQPVTSKKLAGYPSPPPPPPAPLKTSGNVGSPPPSPLKTSCNVASPPPPPPPPLKTSCNVASLPPPPPLKTSCNVASPPPPPHLQSSGNAASPSPPPLPPSPSPPLKTSGNAASPPLPSSPLKTSGNIACPLPPPPSPMSARGYKLPPPPHMALPGDDSVPPPPLPPTGASKGPAVPLPPMGALKGPVLPLLPRMANRSAPPPPLPGSAGLLSKRVATKLRRSAQMGNLYRLLKGKVEGCCLDVKSLSGKQSKVGAAPVGKQGMADALAEMTKKSAYFQQIEEDVRNYAGIIKELKGAISSFQTSDMNELVKFHKYVESHLEKLTDETQVLARFEDFPSKTLEALRMAANLYAKLDTIANTLKDWPVDLPLNQLLDKAESYFSKIKVELDTVERIKDEELKRFQAQKINFDFNILVKIKELMVDVSSDCMESALKEKETPQDQEDEQPKHDVKSNGLIKMMWRAFQFAFRVYTFAGGQDDRADKLTRQLAQEIETGDR